MSLSRNWKLRTIFCPTVFKCVVEKRLKKIFDPIVLVAANKSSATLSGSSQNRSIIFRAEWSKKTHSASTSSPDRKKISIHLLLLLWTMCPFVQNGWESHTHLHTPTHTHSSTHPYDSKPIHTNPTRTHTHMRVLIEQVNKIPYVRWWNFESKTNPHFLKRIMQP